MRLRFLRETEHTHTQKYTTAVSAMENKNVIRSDRPTDMEADKVLSEEVIFGWGSE